MLLQNPKFSQSPPQLLRAPTAAQLHNIPASPCFPIPKQFKLPRRQLTICGNSSLLLLLGSQALGPRYPSKAQAEENPPDNNPREENVGTPTPNCSNKVPNKRAFLDMAIDGEPVGRIVIGLYGDDVPAGAGMFSRIVSGTTGISYRRKEFIKIMPNYVQHGGLRSYGVDAELANKSGSNLAVEKLREEWERVYDKCPGVKNLAGTVSIIVRDPSKPPPKLKLVAREGKLEIDQEEIGKDPNGTEFVIAIKDSPELDASALVVGEVLEGMEVAKRIGQVKTVQENTSSPYFRVAKLIGDKRAVVAERGFNRPYSKVVVINCGLMD
ncbi:peptidyl-prolyl cis-trans isomerase CYP26-2, chloroplastic isoform X2 [Durio zibethinus]|uniref:Peptidyl-prolyl cis-trans isomerase CYP26-2, chloroplastic isoform X2 n=1 Tax=Durio zibethinus TaxID=66656 RepID=A0A6P5XT43_DURZI|nr:peptidyl-prolyl cis-trans isomerase CYP26-2, chloroplastic isoform X2 [Durio zibethinus]